MTAASNKQKENKAKLKQLVKEAGMVFEVSKMMTSCENTIYDTTNSYEKLNRKLKNENII